MYRPYYYTSETYQTVWCKKRTVPCMKWTLPCKKCTVPFKKRSVPFKKRTETFMNFYLLINYLNHAPEKMSLVIFHFYFINMSFNSCWYVTQTCSHFILFQFSFWNSNISKPNKLCLLICILFNKSWCKKQPFRARNKTYCARNEAYRARSIPNHTMQVV